MLFSNLNHVLTGLCIVAPALFLLYLRGKRRKHIVPSLVIRTSGGKIIPVLPFRAVKIGGKGCDVCLEGIRSTAVLAEIVWDGRATRKLTIIPQQGSTRIDKSQRLLGTSHYRLGQTLRFRFERQNYELILHPYSPGQIGSRDGEV